MGAKKMGIGLIFVSQIAMAGESRIIINCIDSGWRAEQAVRTGICQDWMAKISNLNRDLLVCTTALKSMKKGSEGYDNVLNTIGALESAASRLASCRHMPQTPAANGERGT